MSRVKLALKNAKVSAFFYILYVFIQFYARKIFLDGLGDDFIGLTGTLQSFLVFLNLAELGIGSAIGFSLYQPIFSNNRNEINNIISLFGYLYRKIGLIVIALGVLLSLFFPLIFSNVPISLGVIYYAFYTFLLGSLLTYFFNYHLFLLQADQKTYVVASHSQSINLVKIIIQTFTVLYYESYILWISLELISFLLFSFLLRKRISKEYPWLQIKSKSDKSIIKKYPELILKVKQVMAHKLGSFVTNGTDQILIFAFISIEMVAFYGNYQLLINKLSTLTNSIFSGTAAGIGNLVAENKPSNIKKVFWEMMALRFFLGGYLSIILLHLIEPVIIFWLGEKYVLSEEVLILFLINFFILQVRVPVDHFKDAYGLFGDTWAPLAQSVINLTISLIFVNIYGLTGILLGTVIAFILIIMLWRPYYLYKYGFKKSIWEYWKEFSKLLFAFSLTYIVIYWFIPESSFPETSNFWDLMILIIKISWITLIIYTGLLYVVSTGFRDISLRFYKLFIKSK